MRVSAILSTFAACGLATALPKEPAATTPFKPSAHEPQKFAVSDWSFTPTNKYDITWKGTFKVPHFTHPVVCTGLAAEHKWANCALQKDGKDSGIQTYLDYDENQIRFWINVRFHDPKDGYWYLGSHEVYVSTWDKAKGKYVHKFDIDVDNRVGAI